MFLAISAECLDSGKGLSQRKCIQIHKPDVKFKTSTILVCISVGSEPLKDPHTNDPHHYL